MPKKTCQSCDFRKWFKREQNPDYIFDRSYLDYNNKLERINKQKANDVKIRSKCARNEFGENSSKFFLNLEKQHALLNQVRSLLCGEKEVTYKNEINQKLECFYENLFIEKLKFQIFKRRYKCLF